MRIECQALQRAHREQRRRSDAVAPAQVGQGFAFNSNADGVVIANDPLLNVQSTGFTSAVWLKSSLS